MGVNFLIIWVVIDPITRGVITETRVSTLSLIHISEPTRQAES